DLVDCDIYTLSLHDALPILQADDQAVGLVIVEQALRHRLELDDDLRAFPGHALAGAQVEGHARPAPVVDLRAQRDERLGVAVVVDRKSTPSELQSRENIVCR